MDLIDRQAAIDECYPVTVDGEVYEVVQVETLMGLPSAQPEPKTGRWIRKSAWMWTCSCCGKDDAYAYASDDAYEPTVLQDFYCPNCGAKMGGAQG